VGIKRLDYKIGEGDWADTSIVANDVTGQVQAGVQRPVTFSLTLNPLENLSMKHAILLAGLLAAAVSAHAQSATYALDPTHTTVFFEAKHFGTSTNRGRWDKKEGTIVFDKAAKTGKVEVTDMTTINTGVAPFDGHLKSKDFFDAAEFPTAKFVGDKFTFNGEKLVSVGGQLTARQDQPGHADGQQLQLLRQPHAQA
jgi:polyisoprenoid-binding protein YceI